jgi:SAM-dependent methyltransferase
MLNPEFKPSLFHPYYFIRNGLYNKIKEHSLMLQGHLLDFGCGAMPYKSLFDHVLSYTGVDLENEGHSHKNESIDFFYDGKSLPFDNNTYDSIFCSEVFEHVFNLDEVLPELNRVLKQGGKILITCPFAWPEHEKPYDYARYTVYALHSELKKHNFDILITDKNGNFFLTVFQLYVTFLNDVLLPKLTIPILVQIAKKTVIPLMNIIGLLFSKIMPGNKDLYLNNVILAKKNL